MRRSYSARLSSRVLSLYRHEPNAPPGVLISPSIAGLSREVSIEPSCSAPKMPFRPCQHFAYLIAVSTSRLNHAGGRALMTGVTPPDWA